MINVDLALGTLYALDYLKSDSGLVVLTLVPGKDTVFWRWLRPLSEFLAKPFPTKS